MAATFKDILASICSQVTPVSETEFQQIFSLADHKEAKLAYDILLTGGFDVKLYNEENASKLYIARPAFNAAELNKKLEAAHALATNFKAIKSSLDQLNNNTASGIADYAVTLVNSGNHKQISISLIPIANTAPATPKPAAQPAGAPAKPAVKTAVKKKKADDTMLAGPEISRQYSFASKADRGVEDQRKMKNFISRLFVQHVGANGTLILTMMFGVLVIVSLVIASRAFLCPDFAVEKQNHSVFCKKSQEVDKSKEKLPDEFTQ